MSVFFSGSSQKVLFHEGLKTNEAEIHVVSLLGLQFFQIRLILDQKRYPMTNVWSALWAAFYDIYLGTKYMTTLAIALIHISTTNRSREVHSRRHDVPAAVLPKDALRGTIAR